MKNLPPNSPSTLEMNRVLCEMEGLRPVGVAKDGVSVLTWNGERQGIEVEVINYFKEGCMRIWNLFEQEKLTIKYDDLYEYVVVGKSTSDGKLVFERYNGTYTEVAGDPFRVSCTRAVGTAAKLAIAKKLLGIYDNNIEEMFIK